MKRLLYLTTLLMAASLIFAPAAFPQNAKCADFNGDQAAAQAALPQNPQLDRNKDGIACNDLLRNGGSAAPQQPQAVEQTTTVVEQQPQMEQTQAKMTPKTGGPSVGGSFLGLGAGALLVGGGLIVFKRLNS